MLQSVIRQSTKTGKKPAVERWQAPSTRSRGNVTAQRAGSQVFDEDIMVAKAQSLTSSKAVNTKV